MKSIRLINYKCFEDTNTLDLKPLNFLVGSNSSGKSSFLEFFPLLQQSMQTNRDGAFLWVGRNVDLDNFKTVIHNGKNKMSIELEIDSVPLYSMNLDKNNIYLNDVKISFDVQEIDGRDEITEIRFYFNGQRITLKLNQDTSDNVIINDEHISYNDEPIYHSYTNSLFPRLYFGEGYLQISSKGNKDLYSWARENFSNLERIMPMSLLFRLRSVITRDKFGNILKQKIKNEDKISDFDHIYNLALFININEIIDVFNFYMLELSEKIEFIQPLRAPAERYYRKRNISINNISPSGDNVVNYLHWLKRDYHLSEFNNWLVENDMQFTVDVNEEGGFLELNIIEKGKIGKNMVDVGFGYSQIIPILATIWKDINNNPTRRSYCKTRLILIEQPELHLHPRFQRKFAELLSKSVRLLHSKNIDVRFIIETHSQDILNTIGQSIAYGKFDTSLVNIYLFNAQSENMAKYIEKSIFTKDGFLENWPIGFFD